jgi:hypothetical protein
MISSLTMVSFAIITSFMFILVIISFCIIGFFKKNIYSLVSLAILTLSMVSLVKFIYSRLV